MARDEPQPILRDAVYTAAQVAGLVGYSEHTINEEARSGRLRSFVPNGNTKGRKVLGGWVLEWMESGAQGGNQRAPQE